MLTTREIQALLEFDDGEFHAHQIERAKHAPSKHKLMARAQNALMEKGLLEIIGDEIIVSELGTDCLEVLTRAWPNA